MAANTLTRDQAEAIRARYGAGGLSQQSLADEFGVSQVLVSLIVRGKVWGEKPKCAICGTEVDRKRWKHAFCSQACFIERRRQRAMEKHWRDNPKPEGRICPTCGDALPISKRANAAYCSTACEQAAHNATRKASWKTGERQERVSRAYIIARDSGRCHLCRKKCSPAEIHLDHLIPLSRGGTHEAANVRVACAACNLSKRADARNDQLLLVG